MRPLTRTRRSPGLRPEMGFRPPITGDAPDETSSRSRVGVERRRRPRRSGPSRQYRPERQPEPHPRAPLDSANGAAAGWSTGCRGHADRRATPAAVRARRRPRRPAGAAPSRARPRARVPRPHRGRDRPPRPADRIGGRIVDEPDHRPVHGDIRGVRHGPRRRRHRDPLEPVRTGRHPRPHPGRWVRVHDRLDAVAPPARWPPHGAQRPDRRPGVRRRARPRVGAKRPPARHRIHHRRGGDRHRRHDRRLHASLRGPGQAPRGTACSTRSPPSTTRASTSWAGSRA